MLNLNGTALETGEIVALKKTAPVTVAGLALVGGEINTRFRVVRVIVAGIFTHVGKGLTGVQHRAPPHHVDGARFKVIERPHKLVQYLVRTLDYRAIVFQK